MTGPGKGLSDLRWHMRVRDFTVSTREAETEAVIEGRPLPIGEPKPASLPRHSWALATALLWIVWRDEGRVAAELPRLRFWGERMRYEVDDGQLMALDVAGRELGNALAALPCLASTGVVPGGGGSGAIPPEAWPALMLGPLGEDKALLAGWGDPRWETVRVLADAMRREWPMLTAIEAVSTIDPPVPVSTQAAKASGVGRLSKPEVVAKALLAQFPIGPTGLSGPEMSRKIGDDIDFDITESTLKRAIKIANLVWSTLDQTRSKRV